MIHAIPVLEIYPEVYFAAGKFQFRPKVTVSAEIPKQHFGRSGTFSAIGRSLDFTYTLSSGAKFGEKPRQDTARSVFPRATLLASRLSASTFKVKSN